MSSKDSSSDERIKKLLQESKLEEVRKIITGYDRKDLENLNQLIQDPEEFSDEISKLLPLSIKKLLEKGDISLESLRPVFEDVLKESVKKNPKSLTDILFPIMMPAIRKAVADDIKRMLDSLNTVLENSFSAKRIGWHIQALFSGKRYSEIILSHAYIYQVKQIFLIHKETGLLLAQVEDGNQKKQKADLISSMLTAIKDFVQDSFQSEEGDNLDTIELGKTNIWIEQGPKAIIAAIVDGNVPHEYRILLKETTEAIHVNFASELDRFDGETATFQKNTTLLQRCLQKEIKEKRRRKPILAVVFFILAFGFLGYWLYGKTNKNLNFRHLVSAYEKIPGIVITKTGRAHGVWYIKGLQDPEVQVPKNLEQKYDIHPGKVKFEFTSYLSLDPKIVLLRVENVLRPPHSVKLNYRYDTLFVSGNAPESWIAKAKKKAPKIAGVGTIFFKKMAPKPKKERIELEKHVFMFKFDNYQLDSAQTKEFETMIAQAKKVLNFSFQQDSIPTIEVLSHTSKNGNINSNMDIAMQRAQQFIHLMVHAGIPIEELVPKVVFSEKAKDNLPIRSISFKVKYIKAKEK